MAVFVRPRNPAAARDSNDAGWCGPYSELFFLMRRELGGERDGESPAKVNEG